MTARGSIVGFGLAFILHVLVLAKPRSPPAKASLKSRGTLRHAIFSFYTSASANIPDRFAQLGSDWRKSQIFSLFLVVQLEGYFRDIKFAEIITSFDGITNGICTDFGYQIRNVNFECTLPFVLEACLVEETITNPLHRIELDRCNPGRSN
jgi:hypothetical protein